MFVESAVHADKVALITGGGRGIGAAAAKLLAKEGAAVAVASRTKEEVDAVVAEISDSGGRAIPVVVDVTDEDSVSEGFGKVHAELGPTDDPGKQCRHARRAATRGRHGARRLARSFEVNVTGAFLCAREALPHMVSENWGRIINVSSAAARHPVAGMAAYSASKAALDQLTRVLAAEGVPYDIATIGVYPGVVDTRMQEESRNFGPEVVGKQLDRMFNNYRAFGMLRAPEEPAELISYLCTPDAGRLNGHVVRLEQLEALRGEA